MHRVWQAIAILVGLAIIGIGGFTAYVFLVRTASQPPRVTPSPVITASPAPTTSGSTGPGGSPSRTVTPGIPTIGPSGSPRPSPSASPATGPLGTVVFSLERVGLDDPAKTGAVGRSITFTAYGAGDVRAGLSDTTGGVVRLCLYRGSPDEPATTPLCTQGTKGSVRGNATGTSGTWTVVLSGAASGKTPSTTATITYRTKAPGFRLTGFRFQGTKDQPRNGFRVHVAARANGDALVRGSWLVDDLAQTFDHRVHIRDATAASDVIDETANGTDVSSGGAVTKGHEYLIELRNSAADADGSVNLDATVSWP